MDLGLKKRSLLLIPSNDNDPNKKSKKIEQDNESKYGDGMVWSRGCLIGKGCFGSVFLANLKKPKSRYTSYPPIMAVKSAEVSVSGSIQKEKEVLNNIVGCRNVIRCFGEEITNGENGQMVYNLLLEYGSGGTLADLIIRQSGLTQTGLPELDVRHRSKEILCGLKDIHNFGYVHCDLKPENILLVGNSVLTAKICDFGLAKRAKQSKKNSNKRVQFWRGTPMYFSPEVVIDGVQEAPSDIWAFGCIVLEMLTGKPPWDCQLHTNGDEVLARISESNEMPYIPNNVSREAKSFLKGCFSRKAMYRWTAEMLLAHPFLEGIVNGEEYDNRVDDLGDIFDINAISSSIFLENDDDETSFSLFPDDDDLSYLSENEIDFWSEEDVDATLHQYPVSFTITS